MTTLLDVPQMYIYLFFGLIALFILLKIVSNCFIIVPTNQVVLVEYLGQYSRSLSAGFHILLPFIESVKIVRWERTIEDPFTRKTTISTFYSHKISTAETMF